MCEISPILGTAVVDMAVNCNEVRMKTEEEWLTTEEAADELINAVRAVRGNFKFEDWKKFGFTRLDPEGALETAYRFGLIGQKIDINGSERISWSHRPSEDDRLEFSLENQFMVHFAAMQREKKFLRW